MWVVGPVRTGKSTLSKVYGSFVMPGITDVCLEERG